jgi:hypothetical protein
MNKSASRKVVEKYGTTPGGISLDPRINPLHARMAASKDLLAELNARLDKLEAAKPRAAR